VTDLLLASGDAAKVVQELAGLLTLGTGDLTIVSANQAQWDYHPQKVKKGIWYKNFNPALLPSETFAGMSTYMQQYMSPGGYGYNLLQGQGNDAGIPSTPTISYVGAAGFAVDGLAFQTTPFSDPQGAGTFAKIEWRVAEVFNASVANYAAGTPYKYEIEGTWESGELGTFANQTTVPVAEIEPGKTYRARVRMQDVDGHWSHWSAPVEFLATPGTTTPTLAITELHYNPAPNAAYVGDAQELEFIEVLNTGASSVDLSGVQLTTFATIPYVFANGLNLAAGQRIVVAKNPAAFQSVYGTGVNLAPDGYGTSNLSNGGETIVLATAGGASIQTIEFDDVAPWPTTPDGNGPSLEIIDPLGDPSDGANWRASAALAGSPGWDGIPGAPGDYDRDLDVDGNDFLTWQRTLGSRTPALVGADGSNNLQVDAPDLGVWAGAFGTQPAVAAAVSGGVAKELAAEAASPNGDGAPDLGGWILVADATSGARRRGGDLPLRVRGGYRPAIAVDRVQHVDAALAGLDARAVSDGSNATSEDSAEERDDFAAALDELLAADF
jgi:hypothetical protein